jgi:hypothetical protein
MFRSRGQDRATNATYASANWCNANASNRMNDDGRLTIAQQRRAEHIRTLSATPLNWRACFRLLLVASTTALFSAALVIAYAMLLSMEGIAVSTPALLAVLLAATLASIAGFAFSAICGVMLLQIMSNPSRSWR